MVDKDFCLSSYIGLRYIYKEDMDFFENLKHKSYKLEADEEKKLVSSAEEIDKAISYEIENLYKNNKNIGVLLSGGMDSAILASYLKPGSNAYTFTNSNTNIYDPDIERARQYCKKFKLNHSLIDISFEDYKEFTPIVMKRKGAPVHSIEPQIYKAALQAKKDGIDVMIIGDGADYVFGGMDKLLSKEWKVNEFMNRYLSLDPKKVLKNPSDLTDLFESYRKGDYIDLMSFMYGPITEESYGSYENALHAANMEYIDPYEHLKMREKLDLNRVRNGESKYLIRELYKIKYPEIAVPEKIPMPRPVDYIFKDWEGPQRNEFRNDIPMEQLTGNQKWQLWCAELFLNIFEK